MRHAGELALQSRKKVIPAKHGMGKMNKCKRYSGSRVNTSDGHVNFSVREKGGTSTAHLAVQGVR